MSRATSSSVVHAPPASPSLLPTSQQHAQDGTGEAASIGTRTAVTAAMGRTMYFEDVTGKLTATVFRDAHPQPPPPPSTSSTSTSAQNDVDRPSQHLQHILASSSTPLTSAQHPAPASSSSTTITTAAAVRRSAEPGAPVHVKQILSHLSEKQSLLEVKRAGVGTIVLDFSANWDGLGNLTLGPDATPIRMDHYLRPSSSSSASSSSSSSSSNNNNNQREYGLQEKEEDQRGEEGVGMDEERETREGVALSISPAHHSTLSGVQRTKPRSRKRSEYGELDRRSPLPASSFASCSFSSSHHHHHYHHLHHQNHSHGFHPYASPPPSPPRSPSRHLQHHLRRPSSACSRRSAWCDDDNDEEDHRHQEVSEEETYEVSSSRRRQQPYTNANMENGPGSSRTFRASMSDGEEYTWVRTANQTPGARNASVAAPVALSYWDAKNASSSAQEGADEGENSILSFNCYHAGTGVLVASYHPLPQAGRGSEEGERPPAVLELASESDPLLPELVASLTIMRYIARYPDVLVNGQRTTSTPAAEQRALNVWAKNNQSQRERERERKIRCTAAAARPRAPVRSYSASPTPTPGSLAAGKRGAVASSASSPPARNAAMDGLRAGSGLGLGLMTSASTPSLLRLELQSPPPSSALSSVPSPSASLLQ